MLLTEKIILEKTYTSLYKDPVLIISGIHGDEPAGNLVANYYKKIPNVYTITNINPTAKRRYNGKDLNRYFNKPKGVQANIIEQIKNIQPKLVINLHEDDEAKNTYVYCSVSLANKVKNILKHFNIKTAKTAHGDVTDDGVIINGKQPYDGTLEVYLDQIKIPYCTIETPSTFLPLKERIYIQKTIIDNLF